MGFGKRISVLALDWHPVTLSRGDPIESQRTGGNVRRLALGLLPAATVLVATILAAYHAYAF